MNRWSRSNDFALLQDALRERRTARECVEVSLWTGSREKTMDSLKSTAKRLMRFMQKHATTIYFQAREFLISSALKPPSDTLAKVSIAIPVKLDARKNGMAGIKKMLEVYLPKQEHQNYEAIVYS